MGKLTHKLSLESKNDIAKAYASGESVKNLSEIYGVSTVAIYNILKTANVPRRLSGKRSDTGLIINYFNIIDTPAKAYILGFIMADGCVHCTTSHRSDVNRLSINISARDISILEYIKTEIGTLAEIKIYTPKNTYASNKMARLVVNSKGLCSDLARYGVIPRKTGCEYICKEIMNCKYKLDFLRGFFDGDGCIINSSLSKISFFSFCGSYQMMSDIVRILRAEGLIGALTIIKDRRRENIYQVTAMSRHDCEKLFKIMYGDSDKFFLERKRQSIKGLCSNY